MALGESLAGFWLRAREGLRYQAAQPDRCRRGRLSLGTSDGASIDQAIKFFGRAPDFVIPRSPNLDHAANSGRPLVESNPPDAWVADLKGLAGKIATVLHG